MTRTSLIGLFFFATACGGQSLSDGGEAGSAGAGASAGSSGAASGGGGNAGVGGTSTGGSAGAAGVAGTPGSGGTSATCEQQGDGWGGWTGEQPTCTDLFALTLSDMVATDNGDQSFAPGEAIQVSVNLNETSGQGFSYYPGVRFTANHPGVLFGKQTKGEDWLYAIEGCGTSVLHTSFQLPKNIAPGTEVEITANVSMINTDCSSTNTSKLSFVVQ